MNIDKQIKDIFVEFNYKIKEQEVYYQNEIIEQEKFTENCSSILDTSIEKIKKIIENN